jgi:hypothetical protein
MEDIPIAAVAEFGDLPESEESSAKSVRSVEEHIFMMGNPTSYILPGVYHRFSI